MKTKRCTVCEEPFNPKRAEQNICGVTCRQRANAGGRKGQKTGAQKGRVYKKRLNKEGYIVIYAGVHPFANGRLMILEHVALMEVKIGRRLNPGECIHHKNGIKTDNRLANLELMSHAEHSRQHNRELCKNRSRDALGRFA